MDSSKAIGAHNLDLYDDRIEREEDKEEEYDYFLDTQADENHNDAQGYHIADELGENEEEEDLEELDEEEKQQRYREMLKDFKEKIDKEERQ